MDIQKTIIDLIEEEGLLREEVLENVRQQHKQTGSSILTILKKGNYLSEDQLIRLIAVSNQIMFVNLSPDEIDPVVAHLVSYDMANRFNLIPIKRKGNQLVIAMSSPMNLMARDQIEMKTGYKVIPVAATPTAIKQAINFHFDVANVTKQAIASMRLKADITPEKNEPAKVVSERVANDTVTKLVGSIIRGAIDARASDIHIEPQESDVRVRYRVDGMLRSAISVPLSAKSEVVSHIKIMAEMDISEKRVPQDGHMSLRHNKKTYDLRVSSLPAVGGEKLVLRILDKSTNQWNLDRVVTSPDDNKKFRELASNPYGILLVTGPTGSGKTTTLYSLLQLLNQPKTNIVTVEDPVEYRLDGITQVQVRPAAGMTFASALRSILRQDPDIILIGEIRDLETAEIAVSAALTGHLVLSTLHTNDAPGAISRLLNIGVPPFLVGSALIGAVAQRLVRTLCPKCRKAYEPSQEEVQCLSQSGSVESQTLYKAVGCNDCFQAGFKGRKSIYEILTVTPSVRKMIMESANDTVIKEQAVAEGMKALTGSAIEDVLNGNTSLDEIKRVVEIE